MANVIDRTTRLLMDQLERLDALALGDSERVAAECMRATAVNATAKNIRELGDLYVRSQMLQMNATEARFEPGAFFRKAPAVDAGFTAPSAKLNPATSWGDGAKTTINALGEFEDGE